MDSDTLDRNKSLNLSGPNLNEDSNTNTSKQQNGDSCRDSPKNPAKDNKIEIRFEDWGFKIDRLFEVAHKFYKCNESKAFHPSFDLRNKMNALILQAKYGNFDNCRAPDIGVLDLVGKSRRHEWLLLKDMSKIEAMTKFICTLDEICPSFKTHAEAVKINSGFHQASNSSNKDESQKFSDSDEKIEKDEQLKAMHTSLCRQTYEQFKSYAEKQYPGDATKQKQLICSLQEQYYQQYISQMQLKSNHSNPKSNDDYTISSQSNQTPEHKQEDVVETSSVGENHLIPSESQIDYTSIDLSMNQDLNPIAAVREENDFVDSTNDYCIASDLSDVMNILPQTPLVQGEEYLEPQLYQETFEPNNGDVASSSRAIYQNTIETWDHNDSTPNSCDTGSPIQENPSLDTVEAATIWTKKGVREFKESLIDDKQAGTYIVKQGTCSVIQVPTWPDGRYIHWEFATDDYDIGFGLDFVHEAQLSEPLAISIYEESDDDDDFDDDDSEIYMAMARANLNDPESAMAQSSEKHNLNPVPNFALDQRRAAKLDRLTRTVTIIPTYRRDSHEEVFIGRHKYAGQGYYLLKFDNTYSVLRSKTLSFRICYFI